MRIFTEQAIKEYSENHPDAKVALQEWATIVKKSKWTCFADVKKSFNSVDNVGNQHYVFNIKGNNYRLIVVIKFTIKFVYIRFIGTHSEYDKIADCSKSSAGYGRDTSRRPQQHRIGIAFQPRCRLLGRAFCVGRTYACRHPQTPYVRNGAEPEVIGEIDWSQPFTSERLHLREMRTHTESSP